MRGIKQHDRVTRSYGLLEKFLAGKRAAMANKLIPNELRRGKILDIGCGTMPYFLSHTSFQKKFGIDPQLGRPRSEHELDLRRFDVEEGEPLPFESGYFDVVTMLAVFEHIKQPVLPILIAEVFRVLKPNGLFVLTTPCPWTDMLLKAMARFRLVSAEEIAEHEGTYNHMVITRFLETGGFKKEKIKLGYFELYLNNWGVSQK